MGYFKFRLLRWPKGSSRAGVHIADRNWHAVS